MEEDCGAWNQHLPNQNKNRMWQKHILETNDHMFNNRQWSTGILKLNGQFLENSVSKKKENYVYCSPPSENLCEYENMHPDLLGMKNTQAFEKKMHYRNKKDDFCTSISYGYYGPSKSQENVSLEKRVLSTAKSNHVDGRTITNQMNVSHGSLLKKK